MKKWMVLIKSGLKMLSNIRREHIGAFAAQSAFFLIMSFIPMLFLILLVISFYGFGTGEIYDFISTAYRSDIMSDLFTSRGKLTVESFFAIFGSVLVAAWSAGKSFKALTEGFHSILHICESRNYILSRLRGLIYSLIFAVVSATMFLFGVFGKIVYSWIAGTNMKYADFFGAVRGFDKAFVFVFSFVIIGFLYRFVPDWSAYSKFGRKRTEYKYIILGTLLATGIICVYTVLFAWCINEYFNLSNVYGSLATLISVMLWLYGTMYILILGFRLSVYMQSKNIFKRNPLLS